MRTVTYRLADLAKATIHIGKVAENEATRVQFDASQIFAEYPAATPALNVINPAGTAYPAVVTKDGNYVIWDVQDSDLTAQGMGEFQLSFSENGVIIKSCVGRTRIERSIVANGEAPDPVQSWLDEAEEALAAIPNTIDTALAEAKASGEFNGPPGQDGQDGAPGQDGVSPTVKVTEITGGHRVTITDAEGDHPFDVMDGEGGGAEIDDTAGEGDTDKVWSADKSAGEVSTLSSAIAQEPETKGTTASDIDLDVTDSNGNVLVRFAGGHIQTKNFDSSNIVNPVRTRMEFEAHNGANYFAPECTVPAYRIAGQQGWEEAGIAGIDFSTDGTMYVIHDDTVDRTTDGTGYLNQMSDEQINALHITQTGAGYDLSDFDSSELVIPTFEQVLAQCVRYGMKMFIRLHMFPSSYTSASDIAKWDGFVNLLKAYNVKSSDISCYVDSAARATICRNLIGNDVEISTFLGSTATAQDMVDWFTNNSITGNRAGVIHKNNLNLTAVKLMHTNGIKVRGYGETSESIASTFASLGVDSYQNGRYSKIYT